MKIFEKIKRALIFPLVGIIFATSALTNSTPVYAQPAETETVVVSETPVETNESTVTTAETPAEETTENTEETTETEAEGSETVENATCYSQVGGLGWLICPVAAFLARAIDTIYGLIEDFMILEPISMENGSPVFTIWIYARNITNIVFILFLMVIIYSQITGFGISNYGIKKTLPRLIITAILVNLSYIICVLAVDLSNIIGHSLHDFLVSVADTAASSGVFGESFDVSFYEIFTTIAAGGAIGALAIGLSGGPLGLLLAILPVIFGGIVSVIIGLVTISLRQAVIILLVAIAPLAFVAYLLPNTEKWFKKWTNTFSQMLFFYPMFSLLFGASRIASGIFMGSANSMLGVILGLAVQVLPLIFALSLMKMAGTVLGGVSNALGKLGNKATAGVSKAVDPYKNLARTQHLAKGMREPFNPLSGASWRAAYHKNLQNLKFRQDQADKTVAGLAAENLNALRRNERIIGYDKNNQPIYTQRPYRRSNKYMNAEAEANEIELRGQADSLKTQNAISRLDEYQKEHGIRYGRAINNASRMGDHYNALRTQLTAKARNDEADERFYNETVMKAAERDLDGNLKNKDLYEKYVIGALGGDGYKINQTTPEGRRLAEQAAVNVIGDAYSREESLRASNVKRFEAYMDKQVTKEVLRQYEAMIKYDNIDGIIASHEILAKRGDYDKIADHMTKYMNSGKIKLGEDASSRLAMNFLSMKDSAPALARIGKFINMETWAYTDGKRQTQEVTMEQYLTGRVEGDIDNEGNPYRTKINLASGLKGTRLNGIDRTAYAALDAITRQINEEDYTYEEAIEARMAIEREMLPQEVTALPTFASGSEQILSMVGHITGMKYNSKTGVWEDGIAKRSDLTDFQKRVEYDVSGLVLTDYLKALTARDLISMKSDTWAGIVARVERDEVEAYNRTSEQKIDLTTKTADGKNMAHELAKKKLQELLKTRIEKVASSRNTNADMMKEKVFDDLDIEKKRAELHEKQMEEDQSIRDSIKDKKNE